MTLNQLNDAERMEFSTIDYTLFVMMLGLSAVVGAYFAFFSKQDNAKEYLMGGKVMGLFPIAMSLIASDTSGITLLGVPSEVYVYGTLHWVSGASVLIVAPIIATVILPVFYRLQLMSVYEYLERRFDTRIRKTASFFYTVYALLYVPIVIYVPALAFKAVTGISIFVVAPITCLICIFYTTFGGLKAVVWTDALQTVCMIGSVFTVLCIGTMAAGGLGNVWQIAEAGDRIELNFFSYDVLERSTFWSILIGTGTGYVAFAGTSQACMQRFLAVPSLTKAKLSLIFMACGNSFIKTMCCLTGLLMYAKYAGCDPVTRNLVSRSDQLLPYYIIDIARNVPGLPGLFVAGVFSAALSSMSTLLNTLAGTIYEDFLKPFSPKDITEKRVSSIMKVIAAVLGGVCLTLVLVVNKLSGVVQLSLSSLGVTAGPILGLFLLGLFTRTANTKGALCGGITALVVLLWAAIGTQLNLVNGTLKYETKPISIDQCSLNISEPLNATFVPMYTTVAEQETFWLYRLSFYLYPPFGAMCTFIIGIIVSWFTGGRDQIVDESLLSPITKYYSREPKRQTYTSVDNALKIIKMNS